MPISLTQTLSRGEREQTNRFANFFSTGCSLQETHRILRNPFITNLKMQMITRGTTGAADLGDLVTASHHLPHLDQ
jgi:hypothetical protein